MWSAVNICALSLSLAAFTGWTLFQFAAPRRVGWVNLLGGVSILALFFVSIVAPDDVELEMHFHAPISIHSPPIVS